MSRRCSHLDKHPKHRLKFLMFKVLDWVLANLRLNSNVLSGGRELFLIKRGVSMGQRKVRVNGCGLLSSF